jgi:hypothetical protein
VTLFLNLDSHSGHHISSREPHHESRDTSAASQVDHFSGIPLLTTTSHLVGSLHPDNAADLPPPGTSVELILIARSQTPLADSALLQLDDVSAERPSKLLWVLYIVWIDGVAERRGVAQILERALEEAVEPKPCVKSIILG